jgi:putative selenate reductase
MELGGLDSSGRPRPVKVAGSEFNLKIDSLIPAIGQQVELDFFPHVELKTDPETLETQIPKVFAGGDAVRGASSLIKAIGDGQLAADSIMARAQVMGRSQVAPLEERKPDWAALKLRQARRQPAQPVPEKAPGERLDFRLFVSTLDDQSAQAEASRCLQCDIFCNVCTTVCPNRANLAIELGRVQYPLQQASKKGGQVVIETLGRASASQQYQIINLGDFCNECGNCTTFCPSSGAPYLDKARFHLSKQSFENSDWGYFFSAPNALQGKIDGNLCSLSQTADGYLWENGTLKVSLDQDFAATGVIIKTDANEPVSLSAASQMAVWFEGARRIKLLNP